MSYCYPKELEELIVLFKELPGIGQKGAERMVFQMLKWPDGKLKHFGKQISVLHDILKKCSICGNLCTEEICSICDDSKRDRCTICVLEDYTQVSSFEKSYYKGLYHILGGKLSPLENRGADTLTIDLLINRINAGEINEVILALSLDIEGQATSIYIADLLKNSGVEITTLARGIPAGADISYANSATISAAVKGRVKL